MYSCVTNSSGNSSARDFVWVRGDVSPPAALSGAAVEGKAGVFRGCKVVAGGVGGSWRLVDDLVEDRCDWAGLEEKEELEKGSPRSRAGVRRPVWMVFCEVYAT